MTVRAVQPKDVTQRRIIERPRLIKLLDDTDARTILLLAPAGYGKTTLARQWAKTLNGAVWITLTPAHRDVAVLAAAIKAQDAPSEGARSVVQAYVKAHSNPQRRASEIASLVADELRSARTQWLIFDDYHEVVLQPEAEQFVEVLNACLDSRFLIASRLRPTWATARLAVYGDIAEIGRNVLALSREEAEDVLETHPDLENVIEQADGWPAVIGLAASASVVRLPREGLGSDLIHDYFAEELFRSAGEPLRRLLMLLALAPDLEPDTVKRVSGDPAEASLEGARQLGFVNRSNESDELHPLLRDFLLQKVASLPDAAALVEGAVESCIESGRWERAFELILRFDRPDLAEHVLEVAYIPLLKSGQLGTLGTFASRIRAAPATPPPVVELAEADVALADGAFDLATRIARRFLARVGSDHPLTSRANLIVAESAYARAELASAEQAYRAAYETAQADRDATEALRRWALTSLQGEMAGSDAVVAELQRSPIASAEDVVRNAILELIHLRFTAGYGGADAVLAEAEAVLSQVEDPGPRSSFAYVAAYVCCIRGRYEDAARWQLRSDADISSFDLDFARPHSHWNHALIALGLRRFGHAERMLQKLEDLIATNPLDYHVLNARLLRGRLCLQTGDASGALERLPDTSREVVLPSIIGEYLATRSLALAAVGQTTRALEVAEAAVSRTSAAEVRVLASAARAMSARPQQADAAALALWEAAEELDVWDPVVAALRASAPLAERVASLQTARDQLTALYRRSGDHALARRAGLRTRVPGAPSNLLSPRELEVLGLLARGYKNRQIADALVISLSTVKVHVRHIFEKLGARNRAEAVARMTLD